MRVRAAVLLTFSLGSFLRIHKARGFSTVSKYSAATTMSLCFLEAYEAKIEGRINEKEYFGYLTAHLRGVRHDNDHRDDEGWMKYHHWKDQVGAGFRKFALNTRTMSAEETTLYDRLLLQCSAGDFEAMKSTCTELKSKSLPIPVQVLAVLVARKGHADMLEFLLQNGAILDDEVGWATAETPEMLEILWNRNWHDCQQSQKQQEYMVIRALHRPIGMLEFLLRKQVKFPPRVFDKPDSGKLSLPAMKILVEGCGVGALEGTAVLTLAAEEGNRDVVEYLCKLGVPLDDVPPDFNIREPYANVSPLWSAVMKRDVNMMKLLLSYGADPNARFSRHSSKSLLNAVRERNPDDAELLGVLEKYASTRRLSHKI